MLGSSVYELGLGAAVAKERAEAVLARSAAPGLRMRGGGPAA